MKILFLVFLLPLFCLGQTIHFDEDQILYKGSVTLTGVKEGEVVSRMQKAIEYVEKNTKARFQTQASKSGVSAKGEIQLNSPFHIIRTLHFTLTLAAKAGGYDYRINTVFVKEQRRGSEAKVISAEEMLEGMEDTGNPGIENEKLLNEIDMRFQKVLAVLENSVKNNMVSYQ